mmetsp:Transcript_789/g.1317  ORF Transcript_789/g.1317 Transcript_789/m.1317 type:complete len:92 (-) Transcript_789:373-648(-)
MPIANGKLKKRKVAIFKHMTCASNSTVPSNPDNIVVTSKLQASALMLRAPEIANLINGFITCHRRFSICIVGHVSFILFFCVNKNNPMRTN